MNEHPNKITKNNIIGSEWWVNSESLNFPEIVIGSRVMQAWAKFNLIEERFKDVILKPVNRYVSNLYPRPELISINNNIVTLRQRSHAEIWVQKEETGLYALDKTNQRQFYPSTYIHNFNNCYEASYRFYMPWFIDKDIEAEIKNVDDEETAFQVMPGKILFKKQNIDFEYVETNFINFGIKKNGSWMLDGTRGILPIGSAMYDIMVYLNDNEVELIRNQYEQP